MRKPIAIGLLFAAGIPVASATLIPMDQVTGPANLDCHTAVHFCNSLAYTVDPGYVGNSCCLWFQFEVPSSQLVTINLAQVTQVPGYSVQATVIGPTTCNAAPTCASAGGWFNLPGSIANPQPLQAGTYFILVKSSSGEMPCTALGTITLQIQRGDLECPEVECDNCIPDFNPEPGEQYIISAWAKENAAPQTTIHYDDPVVTVECLDGNGVLIPGSDVDIPCSGNIIDGWQRMEGIMTIPVGAAAVRITLTCTTGTCFFDDVRFFPEDGSMKCYVYDPTNLRFMAELDERHYATFYEYDAEGKLARVKKETERGVMTIQETRYNSSQLSGTP